MAQRADGIGRSQHMGPAGGLTDTYCAELVRQLALFNDQDVGACADVLSGVNNRGGSVWVMGNGGSAANAAHLVLHLQALGVKAHDLLGGLPSLTALANDKSYASAPLHGLRSMARAGDVLIVISGSGDSANVLVALAEARRLGMVKMGLLGFGGGAAAELCDRAIVLPSQEYGPIEDAHSAAVHLLARVLGLDKTPKT